MKQLTLMEIIELGTGEHINYPYSPIIGKLIYPCPINPLDDKDGIHKNIYLKYIFENKSKYGRIR